MLHVSVQHCCWTSYQIAEQVTIVNLVALRGPSCVCVCAVEIETVSGIIKTHVLQTHLQHIKSNVCVICVPDYVYMTR